MSTIAEASGYVRQIAGHEGSVKERLRRAHSKLRCYFSFNRVRDLYHAEMRVHVWSEEMDELRRVANATKSEKAASHELSELRDRIARLEAALVATDPDFHSETIASLRMGGHGMGDHHCPVDEG